MNTSEFNASDLNGPSTEGHNAILNGGLELGATGILSAALIYGVILTGGISITGDAEGRISNTLRGGLNCTNASGAGLILTTNLQGGIVVEGQAGSLSMGFEPSLRDGIYSPSDVGGQIKTHVRLQVEDQIGSGTQLGAGFLRGYSLQDGIEKTAYLTGGISGGTVLMADGLKSTTLVSSGVMALGQSLSGGLESGWILGGQRTQSALLQGGVLWTTEMGHELDLEAILTDGTYGINQVGGDLKLDFQGEGGIESSFSFEAKQKLSPTSNDGISKAGVLSAKYKIPAKLQLGVSKVAFLGGKGITASQVLRGGISPAGTPLGGQLRVDAKLQGALVSSGILHGDMVQGFLDPQLNTWALEIRSATIPLEIFRPLSDI